MTEARSSGESRWRVGREVARDFRRTWPQLLLTDFLARAAGFVVLTGLAAASLRLLLLGTGEVALSDEEILFSLLRPRGLLVLLVAATVWAAILFVEQASLMVLGFGSTENRALTYYDALRYSARHAVAITRLAARMIVRALGLSAPFVGAAALVYLLLLTDHDINFYLATRPAAFWVAGAAIGTILLALALVLLRVTAAWFVALPLVLFGEVTPSRALGESRKKTRGHRRFIALWVAGWALTSLAVGALFSGVVTLVARWIIPTGSTSLAVVAMGVAVALVVSVAGNTVVSFVSGSLFALLIVRLYTGLGIPGRLNLSSAAAPGSLGERPSLSVPRARLIASGVLAVTAIGIVGVLVVHRIPVEDDVLVIAHRGASGAAPENTIAAIDRAIADGTDWVEIDVQESADGVVVVAHDKDFMRQSRVSRTVWESTYDELRDIDIGSWFSPEFSGERVPTLREVLEHARGRAGVVIELKYYGHDQRLEERVVEIVESMDMASEVAVMSLHYQGVRKTEALRPEWTYGLLSAVSLGDLSKLDVGFLAVSAAQAGRSLVRAARRSDKQVWVWTVNDPSQMSAMMSLGVDGLITDEPALAKSVLQQRAEMSPVQRLIVAIGARFGMLEDTDETPDEPGATDPGDSPGSSSSIHGQ